MCIRAVTSLHMYFDVYWRVSPKEMAMKLEGDIGSHKEVTRTRLEA